MLGFGSLQSGQISRTARSGPKTGCAGAFCWGAARGNGLAYAIGRGIGNEVFSEGFETEVFVTLKGLSNDRIVGSLLAKSYSLEPTSR